MKKFMIWILILCIASASCLYLGYQPQPKDIDVSGSIFGYNIQTSQYTVLGIISLVLLLISLFLKTYWTIGSFFSYIFSFFGLRSQEKATDALLNAYAFMVTDKPKTAQSFLKKSERFYKDSPYYAVLQLKIDQMLGRDRPATDALARLETHKSLGTIGYFLESQYAVSQKDMSRTIELLEKSGSHVESKTALWNFVNQLIVQRTFSKAETVLKSGKLLFSDEDYRYHMGLLLAHSAQYSYVQKKPEQALMQSLDSLKMTMNPIALYYGVNAYKLLLKDNKAQRLISDQFNELPHFYLVKLFFESKNLEMPEETTKRIAALPRMHETHPAFMCLQAYYFASSKDFTGLTATLNTSQIHSESLWYRAAKLCLSLEKESIFLSQAVSVLSDAIAVEAKQEIDSFYNRYPEASIYKTFLEECDFYTQHSMQGYEKMLALFTQTIKLISLTHVKSVTKSSEKLDNMNLYQIEGNIHKTK